MAESTPRRTSTVPVLTKNESDQEAYSELDSVSLREILNQDSRPTFVLDLDSDSLDYSNSRSDVRPLFCNAALRLHDRLLDAVTGTDEEATSTESNSASYQTFRTWIMSVTEFDDSRDVFPLTLLYSSMLWTGSTIRRRWRVISGNQCFDVSHLQRGDLFEESTSELAASMSKPHGSAPKRALVPPTNPTIHFNGVPTAMPTVQSSTLVSTTPPQLLQERSFKTPGGTSNKTTHSKASVSLGTRGNGVPDWTVAKPRGVLSEHMVFTRSFDWAATPLGPMESWSTQFREISNLVMNNPHPAALFWGEELTMLYNEAYMIEVAGNKHPGLMGTGFSGPFSELWDGVAPIFNECARTGKSVRKENDRLPMERYGYLEETFFSWSFVPVYGGTDRILGFYNGPFETTYQTISSRRLQTLRLLGEKLAEARSVRHFWKCVLDGLEDNHYDIPFALLYSITDSDDADTVSHSSDSTISLKSCQLEGSIGIPDGHPASPPKLDLKRSIEGFVPAFREAMRTREPTILHTRNGTLPEKLIEGIKWRGHGDACTEAIIIPVRPTNGENAFAFLLIGVNPRRAYDEEYKAFAHMLNRQLATSLASFILFEEEVTRNKYAAEAAALQREHLTHQLEVQTSRMRRMTELSPLGMYLFDEEGTLLEANERYFEMTGYFRDDEEPLSFLHHIEEGSKSTAKAMWEKMLADPSPRQEELQFKNPKVIPRDLTGEPIEYWVLASSQPELGPDGKVRSIMGSIADISHMKWAQGLQDRRLREAEEMKRQQNEFIDITSHEMRNPLSAILICADDIRDSLTEHQFASKDLKVAEDCIEAANNIALCVQHQKSIVDDILTVSKMDSNLLQVTPIPVQPIVVVRRAMSMFKPEVQAKDIDFNYCQHRSVEDLDVDWVNLDPSRLLQITVNLITNAIKFTQNLPRRKISVHVGVSTEKPELHTDAFEYVPTRNSRVDITEGEDWGAGQLLYIRIKVEDTGVGLSAEEKRVLFERFAQASPRTHAQYGGSGLGLFISRQLAELHGGQIGVSSEAGAGSTFGFFIQARRTAPETRSSSPGPISLLPVLPAEKEIELRPVQTLTATLSTPAVLPSRAKAVGEKLINSSALHVLIVEDNLVNQRVLSKQLQKAGCTVYTADNGVHALAHLATTAFQQPAGTELSIILMDLEMPKMNGLECVTRIREMEAEGTIKGHVPVIAVTANVRDEQMQNAIEIGMDDVVSKPFRIPELLAKIRLVLERLGAV